MPPPPLRLQPAADGLLPLLRPSTLEPCENTCSCAAPDFSAAACRLLTAGQVTPALTSIPCSPFHPPQAKCCVHPLPFYLSEEAAASGLPIRQQLDAAVEDARGFGVPVKVHAWVGCLDWLFVVA